MLQRNSRMVIKSANAEQEKANGQGPLASKPRRSLPQTGGQSRVDSSGSGGADSSRRQRQQQQGRGRGRW